MYEIGSRWVCVHGANEVGSHERACTLGGYEVESHGRSYTHDVYDVG